MDRYFPVRNSRLAIFPRTFASDSSHCLAAARFNRELQAVYDDKVRSIPCDGDVLSLFYRLDLFEEHGIQPPRTWDEYTEVAKYFHGMKVPAQDGSNRTKTLVGSCIDRGSKCVMTRYWDQLVHSSIAQSQGTSSGMLFDTKTFEPNLGEALAETLRHIENQIKYGSENGMFQPLFG